MNRRREEIKIDINNVKKNLTEANIHYQRASYSQTGDLENKIDYLESRLKKLNIEYHIVNKKYISPNEFNVHCYVFTVTEPYAKKIFDKNYTHICSDRYDENKAADWCPFAGEPTIKNLLDEMVIKSKYNSLKVKYVSENHPKDLAKEIDDNKERIFCIIDGITAYKTNPWFHYVKRLDSKEVGGIIIPFCLKFGNTPLKEIFESNRENIFPVTLSRKRNYEEGIPFCCELMSTDKLQLTDKLIRGIKQKYPIENFINRPEPFVPKCNLL